VLKILLFDIFCEQKNSMLDSQFTSTITITFCDVAENGPGMQKIGTLTEPSFSCERLEKLSETLTKSTKLYRLHRPKEAIDLCEKASILVIRNYLDNADELMEELINLEWDKKSLMRGQVKNKLARHNLCFADFNQVADYENGKGTIFNFAELPCLKFVRESIINDFNVLPVAEGNYYYDAKKCGIAGHGDVERNFVIGIRLGSTMDLCYQWYHNSKPVGNKVTITLNHGDLYIMSDKAIGRDWKKRSQYTLRHSAGCSKYTTPK
jgi:hypothetical protein